MTKMRIAPADRPQVKLECLRFLTTLRLDEARTQLIKGFLDRYLALSAEEFATLQQEVRVLEPPVREAVMKIVNEWEELGAARGRQEGRQEGQARVALRLIRRRFGEVSGELESQIRALPAEKSEELAEALLDFSQITQVQAWLAANA
jgi:hypothetical protein